MHIINKLYFYPKTYRIANSNGSTSGHSSVVPSIVCITQEAQLSQRGRAMFCVNEYFAKSLKVIENSTIR